MNGREYKNSINLPNVLTGTALKSTLAILEAVSADEVDIIKNALSKGGIVKPDKHNSPRGFDYFRVECTANEAFEIAGHLIVSEAAAIPGSGETTTLATHYASLVDTWTNLWKWLENGGCV